MCYNIHGVLIQVDIIICLAGHEEATVYFIVLLGVLRYGYVAER